MYNMTQAIYGHSCPRRKSVNLSAMGIVITTGPEFRPQYCIKNASKDHLTSVFM